MTPCQEQFNTDKQVYLMLPYTTTTNSFREAPVSQTGVFSVKSQPSAFRNKTNPHCKMSAQIELKGRLVSA